MTTNRFYRRCFLNRRGYHSGAYVLADCQVEVHRPRGEPTQHSIDAAITLADCGRIATLDFSADNEPAAQNALHKARLLRDVVVDFTLALETAVDERRDRQE